MAQDDSELFQAWTTGDRSAGETLIERHYDSMVGFFRAKTGPHSDDLVQRTFLRCLEARDRFRAESSFRTFLFGIARNVLLEFFRSRSRDARVDPDFTVASIHDQDPGLSSVVKGRADQRLLVEALKRIPLEIQLTLELYYWEDMSVAELAEVLEIPAGTVKSRLHRGRNLLKDAMEKIPASNQARESVRLQLAHWAENIRPEDDCDGGDGSPT